MRPFYVLTSRTSASAPTAAIPATLNASASKFGRFLDDEQVTARFSLNADGSCSIDEFGNPGAWATPIGGAYGSSYWAIVTLTAGTLSSGTVGARVSLATGYAWTITTTGYADIRKNTASGTIQIWDAASAGTMVASGTFYIYAEVDNVTIGGPGGGTEDFKLGQPLQKF